MADPMQPGLEVPQEMRNMATSSLDQARRAFDQFMTATRDAVGRAEKQASSMQSSALGVNRRMLGFAEKNVDAAFELAAKLAQAKDPQEMMRLQTEFLQSQASSLNDQMRSVAEAAAQAAGTVTKSG